MSDTTVYLVWSNDANAWWGPNSSGYTGDVWTAGRYDEADARGACGMRSWSDTPFPPPEVMVLAPENGKTHLTVDEVRAAPALMRQRVTVATHQAIREREEAQARS